MTTDKEKLQQTSARVTHGFQPINRLPAPFMMRDRNLFSPSLALLLILFIISGCSLNKPKYGTGVSRETQSVAQSADKLLAQAKQQSFPRNIELIIQAAGQLQAIDTDRAKTILDSIKYDELSPKLQASLALQQAYIADKKGHSQDVFSWLEQPVIMESNDTSILRSTHIMKAKAYNRFGEYTASLDEWIDALPMMSSGQKEQYSPILWNTLLHVPENRLQALSKIYTDNDISGWMELALIYQPGTRLTDQLNRLIQWKQQWSNHLANRYLPENLEALQKRSHKPIQKIAILLPTSGHLEKVGKSVQRGFLAAYYRDRRAYEDKPELLFLNSDGDTIENLLQQAYNSGAELIIGPLEKGKVEQLPQNGSPIPILALNYSDSNDSSIPIENLYQFGLSAEDEARIVAERAWLDGYKNALILSPDNNRGEKIQKVFRDTWQQQGGTVVLNKEYDTATQFSPLLGKLLNLPNSQQRAKKLSQLLNQSLGFEPRRRQDIDVIFVAASPKDARQIKPALAYQFAGNIPVYATSNTYSGKTNRTQDRDLEGIRIPVMPWFGMSSTEQQQLKNAIQATWPLSKGSYGTLYALGADTYILHTHLQQLISLPGSSVQGLTGALHISPNGRVSRKLRWYVFRYGKLASLPLSSTRY
ncbi:Penicillin-binding protein activator LpoA [invertebrate metagenome]|uniref:Penicillin-binding protein activator LpoA n=1 Tax=invertebrate metagenome TaxID=1711999 RepID=A0A2H9T7Y0_9ZZZZ